MKGLNIKDIAQEAIVGSIDDVIQCFVTPVDSRVRER
jgi:hypothetical protein